MESLPDDICKCVRVDETESTLTVRRSMRPQALNLVGSGAALLWGGYGLFTALSQRQVSTASLYVLLITGAALYLRSVLTHCRAQVVLDRRSDTVLDRGKVVGRLSAIVRVGMCHKTGVTKIVARFDDGRTVDLSPCVLCFARDDEAQPVCSLVQEFVGVGAPTGSWSVPTTRESVPV